MGREESNKFKLFFDWFYQMHLLNELEDFELVDLLFAIEACGYDRSFIHSYFNEWKNENRTLPKFRSVEKLIRGRIALF